MGYFVVEKEVENVLREASNMQNVWVEALSLLENKFKVGGGGGGQRMT